MQQALGGLGAEMENYVEEAKRNVPILESETTWNEPNSELESTKIGGKTISMGQIYSLFIYYIDRQKSQGNEKAYVSLVGGLVQALASTQAMQQCKTGAMSGMGNTTFKEEFKEEKPNRTYGMVGENILHKITVLKTFLINALADYKPGTHPFSTQNTHLMDEYKKVSQTNIGNNELLEQTLQIFNQTPLEHIFGPHLHSIKEIIIKEQTPTANGMPEALAPEQAKLLKDVHTFIINPALFALLSKEYSDIVAFTRESGKLNFTDFAKDTEDTILYDPELFQHKKGY